VSLNSTTYKEGSNSFNINLSGTSTTNLLDNTSYSADYSDADNYLVCWFYVKDQTTLDKINRLQIELGDDASNNWKYRWTTISVGWNKFVYDVNSPSATEGTTDLTSVNYVRLYVRSVLGTETTSAGDIMIDDIFITKKVDTSSVTTTTDEVRSVKFSGIFSTSVNNGNTIRESGLFSDDNVLIAKFTHGAISKNSTLELAYDFDIQVTNR
jgi:hypothetical protein